MMLRSFMNHMLSLLYAFVIVTGGVVFLACTTLFMCSAVNSRPSMAAGFCLFFHSLLFLYVSV